METSDVLTGFGRPAGRPLPPPAPWMVPVDIAGPGPMQPVIETEWLLYTSKTKGVDLTLTDMEIRNNGATMALRNIDDVAFVTSRRHQHHVLVAGRETKMHIQFSSSGLRRTDPYRRDYIEIVKLLESRVFPRLLQARLQRIDMGLTVRVGKLDLRRTGPSFKVGRRRRTVRWVDFDHVVLETDRLVLMTRTQRGRHRVFGSVPLDELNAVLLPALLPAAASSFRDG